MWGGGERIGKGGQLEILDQNMGSVRKQTGNVGKTGLDSK